MRSTFKKISSKIFVGCFSLYVVGCATSGGPSDPGFRQKAAPSLTAVPLPVEIAKDIERISEEGLLVSSENPAYSSAFGQLSKSKFQHTSFLDCAMLAKAQQERCQAQNEKILSMIESGQVSSEELNTLVPDVNAESGKSEVVKSDQYQQVNYLNEDDMLVKQDGPLAQSVSKKNKGPLGFKSKMQDLPELTGGETVNYVVRLGDTLMKIAFEKYANYLRWKDIYKINKNKMHSPERMRVGTELTIKNVKYVYIQRDGRPYLIKKMDTLKSISQKLYGTPDRWEEIWKNNPQLIQNPKKIYTGFTLYYQQSGQAVERREPSADTPTEEKK